MKYKIVIIFTLITLSIIILLLFSKHQEKSTHHNLKETFTTTRKPQFTLNKEYNESLYDAYGIKKCNILSIPNNNVSSNYIDTHRIRNWKPSQSNPLYASYKDTTNTHDYCYYFTDSNDFFPSSSPDIVEAVQDPLASIADCSSNNQLFKDVPFIDGVFIDNNADVTNALPYNKCVLKINKANATPSNVSTFWDQKFKESDAFCQGFVKTVNQEVKRYQSYIGDLVMNLIPFRDRHKTTSNLDSQLNRFTNSNDILRNKYIPTSQKELSNLQQYIDKQNTTLLSDIQSLQQNASSRYEQYLSKHSHYVASSNNVVLLQDNQTIFQRALSESNILRQMCDENISLKRIDLSNAKTINKSKISTFNIVAEELATCNKNVTKYNLNIHDAHVLQEDLGVGYSNVTKAFKACDLEHKPLPPEEEYLRGLLTKYYGEYLECEKEKARVDATVRQLEKRNKAIQDDIDDIKKRCRTHHNSLQMVQVDVDRTTSQHYVTNQQKACETVQGLRKRRMELSAECSDLESKLGEINELANGCQKKKQICGCFQYVKINPDPKESDGWNDYGIENGTRALTTIGRIDVIRKYLPGYNKGEAYIRWRTSNGGKTGLYQIINTRRCEKNDCANYIDVEAPIQTNGGKLIAMELFKPVST